MTALSPKLIQWRFDKERLRKRGWERGVWERGAGVGGQMRRCDAMRCDAMGDTDKQTLWGLASSGS